MNLREVKESNEIKEVRVKDQRAGLCAHFSKYFKNYKLWSQERPQRFSGPTPHSGLGFPPPHPFDMSLQPPHTPAEKGAALLPRPLTPSKTVGLSGVKKVLPYLGVKYASL